MDANWSGDKSWFSVKEAFTGNSVSVLQFCSSEGAHVIFFISYSPVPFLN